MRNKLILTALGLTTGAGLLQAQLGDGLVSYWPLDVVQGTKTPDLVSGYDMNLNNLSEANLVDGKKGKTFSFSFANQTLLSRVHDASDELPINKHPSFTISMWVKANGVGQNDLRIFSEGNTGNSDPLFNIGTDNGGASASVDLFFRQAGWTAVNHIKSEQPLFDDQWRHLIFVQNEGLRSIYIDGVLDSLEIAPKEEGAWLVNNTTIGGILRGSASHWITGLIDEVAVWKRALSEAEISTVNTEGLNSLFPAVAEGLISHWPLDEVQGTKTPDVVSGYDMNLNNLSAADLVTGVEGNAFNFSFANQTLLSRVHDAGDQLPANKHESFTITMWVKANGVGQNDLRIFSEGNTGNSDPLFNIGTDNGGASESVDLFFRQSGWTTVNHIKSEQALFDDQWRHLAFVQTDGTRAIYIDGVLDSLEIPPKEAGDWLVNNTTIGGILRGSASHWITGLIDEVAIWGRALSSDEVVEIKNNGVPEVFSQPLPLTITRFRPDYPTVAQGGNTVLRWEVSKDAQISIEPGIGDVTEISQFGVGSTSVAVTQPTVFTITATRGGESISREVRVETVANVSEGWLLVDNFETYSAGPIDTASRWKNPEGDATLVDLGVNKALGFIGGNDLNALPLESFTVNEGSRATVFFRFFASSDDENSAVGINFGLTEKAIRFVGDHDNDLGPFGRFEKATGFGDILLGAANGVGAAIEFSTAFSVAHGRVYNVWLDVQNETIEAGDIYSIHIQEEGQEGRVTLFENYVSDRNPAGQVDLGLPFPNLDHLLMAAIGTEQGTETVLIDDIYISLGAFLDTIPVPASPFKFSEPPIAITSVAQTAEGFTFTWSSTPGRKYVVQSTTAFDEWTTLANEYPAAGATGLTTSYTDTSASFTGPGFNFYRIFPLEAPKIFSEDFESGANGWTVANNSGSSPTIWELGTPVNGPASANSGSNAYGTDLDGLYQFFTDTVLRSPIIDLTGHSIASLEFFHYLDVEPPFDGELYDFAEVNILDASGAPLVPSLFKAGGVISDWRRQRVSLPAEALGRQIRLEFRMVSDDFQPGELQQGWYIDDVSIVAE